MVKQNLNIHFEKGEYWGFIYSVKGKIKNPEIIPGLDYHLLFVLHDTLPRFRIVS